MCPMMTHVSVCYCSYFSILLHCSIYSDCYGCKTELFGECSDHPVEWIKNKSKNCSFDYSLRYNVKGKVFADCNAVASSSVCECAGREDVHVGRTLPDDFKIMSSTIIVAGKGVFTDPFIAKGTTIGPYTGEIFATKGMSEELYKLVCASSYVS